MSSSLDKPYHHITDEKGNTISFRNPVGSPERSGKCAFGGNISADGKDWSLSWSGDFTTP